MVSTSYDILDVKPGQTTLQKDTLMELSFHVPTTNTTYVGDEERPPAQVHIHLALTPMSL